MNERGNVRLKSSITEANILHYINGIVALRKCLPRLAEYIFLLASLQTYDLVGGQPMSLRNCPTSLENLQIYDSRRFACTYF